MSGQISHRRLRRPSCFIKKSVIAIITAFTLSSLVHAAEGVFIYRESSAHPIRNSTVMEYNSFKKWEALTQFNTTHNGIVKVTKFQPLQIIPYLNPQKPGSEIRTRSIDFWKEEYSTYRITYNTHPASRVYLINQVLQLKAIVAQLSAGNAWFEGKWIEDHKVDEIKTVRKKGKLGSENSKDALEHNERLQLLIDEAESQMVELISSKNNLQKSIQHLKSKIQILKAQLK